MTENYLTEKLSMAKHILDTLVGLESKDFDEFAVDSTNFLESTANGERIGSGAFAEVYGGKSGGGYVVKIVNYDPEYHVFYGVSHYEKNPILPRFLNHREVRFLNGDVAQLYILEKLDVNYDNNTKFDKKFKLYSGEDLSETVRLIIKGTYEQYIDVDKADKFLKEYANRTFEELVEFSRILSKVEGGGYNDIHNENFGFDAQGGLVIFDPVA